MPPKKAGGKAGGGSGGPSVEQMRLMGMPEEQIQQLLALRGMSADERKRDAAAEDARQRFDHARRALDRAEAAARDETAKAEATARGTTMLDFEAEYEVARRVSDRRRADEEREAKRRALEAMRLRREELVKRQEAERAASLETWAALPDDVRAARIAELNSDLERKQRELQEAFAAEQERVERAKAEHEAAETARRARMQLLREEQAKWGIGSGAARGDGTGAHSDDLAHESGQAMLETKQTRNVT
jgi:hypothetical protein